MVMESSGKGPKQLHILIVGAGLGGIMLGVMLEHANISYQILERWSAISIGPTVMRVMAQLGLMEELLRESKPIRRLRFFNKMDVDLDPNQHDGEADMMFCEERYGHAIRVIPRSILYRILLSHIPPDKIHFNKRVIRTQEHDPDGNGNSNGFMSCFCEDGGSILVGADGTYSTIRQELFQRLQASGEVEIDGQRIATSSHCFAGITEPLDTEEFEALGENTASFNWLMPLTNYRIAWTLFCCHLPEDIVQEYKTMHEHSWHSSLHSSQEKPTREQRPWHRLSKKIFDRAHATLDKTIQDRQCGYSGSNWFDHIIGGHGFGSRVLGYWFFRFLPRKLFFLVTDRFFRVRPLLPFLPSVSDTGCISPASYPLC
ncbi:MAG: hypothetical protein J3Q66DRAFT_362529 [Benniella sp.]|nr:MAG: hypothetical protein J3Q66DRAFT_362529 [Benniella sp.]